MLFYSGNMRMNDDAHKVTVGNDAVVLTNTEYEILKLLLENKGMAVSSGDIAAKVGASDSVKVHICNLRKKVGYCRIESVYGFGYMVPSEEFFRPCK